MSEDTHDKLIASGTELFAKHGFDGVSVKELAEQAGVNVSLVSYHFGGKEGLYRACLEKFGEARLAVARRILQPPETIDELRYRLKMFLEEMFACHLDNVGASQLVHHECEMEVPLAPEVFQNTFLKVFQTMAEFFGGAKAAGLMRAELDPTRVTQIVFASVVHIAKSDKLTRRYMNCSLSDRSYRDDMVEHLIQFTLFGISQAQDSPERTRT